MRQLNVEWSGDFALILDFAATIATLNLAIVTPSCIVTDSLATNYIGPLLVPVGVFTVMLFWLFISRLLGRLCSKRWDILSLTAVLNTIGMVWQGFYISIVLSVVRILECIQNPNGLRTVRSIPFVVCWTDEHDTMVHLGIVFFLALAITPVAVVCWLTIQAPVRVTKDPFRNSTRFLFYKYSPTMFWAGLPMMVRSLLLALVPVIEADDSFMQIIMLQSITVGSLYFHCMHLPYLDACGNHLEALELCTLLLILCLGSWFTDYKPETGDIVSWVLVAAFVVMSAVIFISFGYALCLVRWADKVRNKHRQKMDAMAPKVRELAQILGLIGDDKLEEMLNCQTYQDLNHLSSVIAFVCLEAEGNASKRFWRQRLPITAKDVRRTSRVTLMLQNTVAALREKLEAGAAVAETGEGDALEETEAQGGGLNIGAAEAAETADAGQAQSQVQPQVLSQETPPLAGGLNTEVAVEAVPVSEFALDDTVGEETPHVRGMTQTELWNASRVRL